MSNTPPPNFGEIPLPPGMTLAEFEALQGKLVTIAITVAVAFGILAWDYFALLPKELEIYYSSNGEIWRVPVTYAFIVLRCSGILATLPALFFTSVQDQHCQSAVLASTIGAVFVVASSGIIFCYRVCALWRDNYVVYGIAGFAYATMLGCWIAVAVNYKAITGPPTPFGSNCQMLPIVSWAPISYASSVMFDAVILILTFAKLYLPSARKSTVGKVIFRDSLIYFLLTAATNIVVLSIQALDSNESLLKPTAVPFSTLITATMGARVFLNLKLLSTDKNRLPFSNPSSHNSRSDNHVALAKMGKHRENKVSGADTWTEGVFTKPSQSFMSATLVHSEEITQN